MKRSGKRLGWVLCAAVTLGPALWGRAATIDYLGLDVDRGAPWRSTSNAKPATYDPNRDNAYGSDGYYCIDSAAGGGGTVIASLPAYISNVTVSAPNNWTGYAALNDPTLPISSTVANMPVSGIWYANVSSYTKFFTVTLATAKTVVMAVILDTYNAIPSEHNATTIKIVGPGGIINEYTGLTPNAIPDYAFFKISGSAGDSFEVWLSGGSIGPSTAGLGFELAGTAESTVTHVGMDLDRGAPWRSSNVPKLPAFDPNRDNAYGSDGYYCNDGTGGPGMGTVIESRPAYISSITAYQVRWSPYSALDDPRLAIGPDVGNFNSGLWYDNPGGYLKYFAVTLTRSANVLLTVILDSYNAGAEFRTISAIKVVGPGCLAEQTGLSQNSITDYTFFQIKGLAGDTFEVWLNSVSGSTTAGLGFEEILPPRGTIVKIR